MKGSGATRYYLLQRVFACLVPCDRMRAAVLSEERRCERLVGVTGCTRGAESSGAPMANGLGRRTYAVSPRPGLLARGAPEHRTHKGGRDAHDEAHAANMCTRAGAKHLLASPHCSASWLQARPHVQPAALVALTRPHIAPIASVGGHGCKYACHRGAAHPNALQSTDIVQGPGHSCTRHVPLPPRRHTKPSPFHVCTLPRLGRHSTRRPVRVDQLTRGSVGPC